MSTVLLTVYCALCKAERGISFPGKLGEVRRWPSGRVGWGVEDHRGDRQLGREQKLIAFVVLVDPSRSTYTAPETLPTNCERHGAGRVSTGDVVGKRGTVYLTPMSATA